MTPASETSDSDSRSRSELRVDLVETAGELLRGQGVGAFSTTKVAEACDTSTQMIYTLFGGKSGLLKSVYETKARELQEEFEKIDEDDPVDYFYELGNTYRQFLLNHAAMYDSVFSLEALDNYERPDKLLERVETFDWFEEALEQLIDEGLLPEDTDVEALTDVLWGAVNGHVQLTMLDFFPDEETARARYDQLIVSILNGHTDLVDLVPDTSGEVSS